MKPNAFPVFSDVSSRKLAYGASLAVIALSVFAFIVQVDIKKDVVCEIVSPGEVKVEGMNGLIGEVFVAGGDRVKAGQPLFVVERDISLTSDGKTRRGFVDEDREQRLNTIESLATNKRKELESRIASFKTVLQNRRQEQVLLETQITEATNHVMDGEKTLARLKSVADYVVADRIEQAQGDLTQRRIALSQRQAQRQQISSDIANTNNSLEEARRALVSLESEVGRDRQGVQAEYEKNRSTMTVSAPMDGVVSFSQAMVGRNIKAEDVVMAISAEGPRSLQAALRIPSRERGFVKEGQPVRLKFDAFPYARFGTMEVQIDSISRNTIVRQAPSPMAQNQQGDEYMAYAQLPQDFFAAHNERHQILPGMRATASVLVERRTIAEWVIPALFEVMRG